MFVVVVVFFFKQKTAYEMRISDWSSDVCSSDLLAGPGDWPWSRRGPATGRLRSPRAGARRGYLLAWDRCWRARARNPPILAAARSGGCPSRPPAALPSAQRRPQAFGHPALGEHRTEERAVGEEWVGTRKIRGRPDH